MKKLLLLLPLVVLLSCSPGRQPYPASDPHIRIMGRHLVDEQGAVKFAASGVTFYMKFRGRSLGVDLEDEFRDSTSYNWFTVITDGGQPHRFRTTMGQTHYTLADSLESGVHTLVLSKATEGQNGHNRLVSVQTQELLQADPLPERRIEFIGNSITCGYGADARPVPCNEGTWFDKTHAWQAYGPRVARRLNARWMLSSVSGMGMHRNWNSPAPVMPDVYEDVYMEYTDDPTPWDFSRYTPQLVVIALGTNDFSDGDGEQPRPALDGDAFVEDYTDFVGTVRGHYPDANFLLLNSPMLDTGKKAKLGDYLQRVIDNRMAAGDSAITSFAWENRYTAGCDGHPSLEQQGQMADKLEPVIREYMGW